jgi:porin
MKHNQGKKSLISTNKILKNTLSGTIISMVLSCNAFAEGSASETMPIYSADSSERSYLLGDFNGSRSNWANKGFTFDIDYNQYFQAVTSGGLDERSEYGGTLDYNINMDFGALGWIPGGYLQIRGVSRYGESVNSISGSIIPVNTDATHPTTSTADDSVGISLPVFNYTQFLSDKFALGFGKYDTYDSSNEFSGGRGKSQWWNQNLNMPVSPALIVPYSVLGGSIVYLPSASTSLVALIATSSDTTNSAGFDKFDEGMFALFTLTQQYNLADMPGGLGVMYGYGWDGDFNKKNAITSVNDTDSVTQTEDNTWLFTADAWQYLWVEKGQVTKVDSANGKQDLEGVGMFARVQFADKDTNPIDYIVSVGVNARGIFPSRDNDTLGLGYSHNEFQVGDVLTNLGVENLGSAWELFYNIEITPAIHVNLDAQYVKSPFSGIDTATIFGASLRFNL